jgi:uncharacterized membrane protein YhaH (DUF805 family)
MDLRHLYTSFDGRINRGRFWFGALSLGAVNLTIMFVVAKLLGASFFPPDFRLRVISLVGGVLVLHPLAALMVKRLHDRDRPAWLAAVFLGVPMVQSVLTLGPATDASGPPSGLTLVRALFDLVFFATNAWGLIELGCLRGNNGPNRHGPDPLAEPEPTHRVTTK